MIEDGTRTELVKDESELSYLLEKLTKLEDIALTEQTWKDVSESWKALLALRSQLHVECGQQVLECMCADVEVLKAVGAADQFRKTLGDVPNDIVTLLSEGLSAHIRGHAYKYRKKLNAELARVRRVKEIQLGVITSTSTSAAAALLAAGNVIGRMYNQLLEEDGTMAAIVAGAVVGGLLLCCLCVGGLCCYGRGRLWKGMVKGRKLL